jgi:hypothetical protein
MIARIVAVIPCVLLASCAALRIQTLRDRNAKTIWLSKASDDSSLNKLVLLNKGKIKDADSQFVMIETGAQVYITEETTKRCRGMAVFKKVQIKDGPNKGLEGWICGAFTTHQKVWAL